MKAFLREFWHEFYRAACYAPRFYFAPITGAIKGIKAEYRRLEELRAATNR